MAKSKDKPKSPKKKMPKGKMKGMMKDHEMKEKC